VWVWGAGVGVGAGAGAGVLLLLANLRSNAKSLAMSGALPPSFLSKPLPYSQSLYLVSLKAFTRL